MSHKTYIHYPADRLIEGKLWPHKVYMPNQDDFFMWIGDETRFFDEPSYQESLKLALANSIPFDKEFVEQIRIAITESDDYNGSNKYQREPSHEKVYEIEGIEAKVKIDCSHESCIGECAKCTHLQKFVIIKKSKEEPQESQEDCTIII